MSYDVGLYDANDDELTSRNMTSNVAPMWRAAGCDLATLDGRPAGDVLPDLIRAIKAMVNDPHTYQAMNPANGWGPYESCMGFLWGLARDFGAHPDATVVVSS